MTHDCNAYCVFKSWVSDIRGGEPNTPDLGIDDAYEAITSEALAPLTPLIEAARAYRDALAGSQKSGGWDSIRYDVAVMRLLEAARTFEGQS